MSKDLGRILMAKGMAWYIDFVYKTSSVSLVGHDGLLRNPNGEKMVALFWHGDSFCLYPSLRGLNLYIVVTKDRRGDYIADVCRHYGYHALRVPDASDGENHLFKIRRIIAGESSANIAITVDGPIGVYHVPKDFALAVATLTKRRVMPITAHVKRCIRLTSRWDKFKIPLPFNNIVIRFHEPMNVARNRGEDPFSSIKAEIVSVMEQDGHETTKMLEEKEVQ